MAPLSSVRQNAYSFPKSNSSCVISIKYFSVRTILLLSPAHGRNNAHLIIFSKRPRLNCIFHIDCNTAVAFVFFKTATIYRRWSTKEALLLEAASCLSGGPDDLPDTGSLRGDLVALYEGFLPALIDGIPGQMLPQMVAEGTRNPEIRALLAEFANTRRTRWRTVLERAVDRGELVEGLETEVVVDCLTGPLFTRLLVTGRPLTPAIAEQILDVVLAGVTPRP